MWVLAPNVLGPAPLRGRAPAFGVEVIVERCRGQGPFTDTLGHVPDEVNDSDVPGAVLSFEQRQNFAVAPVPTLV